MHSCRQSWVHKQAHRPGSTDTPANRDGPPTAALGRSAWPARLQSMADPSRRDWRRPVLRRGGCGPPPGGPPAGCGPPGPAAPDPGCGCAGRCCVCRRDAFPPPPLPLPRACPRPRPAECHERGRAAQHLQPAWRRAGTSPPGAPRPSLQNRGARAGLLCAARSGKRP